MEVGEGAEPRIAARRETKLSPWFTVVEKDVQFPTVAGRQTYYAVGTLPYVKVYAVTTEGTVPLVRQYRPAVEKFTWELPAGLLDVDEPSEETARRELAEETGLLAESMVLLGTYDIDTGRAEGSQHVFLALCGQPRADFRPEEGMEVAFVPEPELPDWIESGRISSLPHVGAIHVAHLYRQRSQPSG